MKLRIAALACLALLITVPSRALVITWSGGAGGGNVLGVGNWDIIPLGLGDDLVFPNVANTTVTFDSTLLLGQLGLNSFTAGNVTFSGTGTSNYTFNGSGTPILVLNGNVTASTSSASTVIFASTLAIELPTGDHVFNVSTGNTVQVDGVISGLGHLSKTGAGTLVLTGANTYNYTDYPDFLDATSIHAGTVHVNGGTINHTGVGDVQISLNASDSGALLIDNGGTVNDYFGVLAQGSSSTATATVSGSGSTWNNSSGMDIGRAGVGTLNILAGADVTIGTYALVGWTNTGVGTVNVDGAGSTWTSGGDLTLGGAGSGTLTVSNGASVSFGGGTGLINLATSGTGSGTLNIGAAVAGPAAAGGIIDAATITTVAGSGTLQFNTTATSGSPYYLTTDSTSGSTAVAVTGATKVINTAGYNVLTAANTYTGATTINGGTLAVSSLADGGTASGIGAASNAAVNLVLNGGTLRYTGGDSSTDRLFTLGPGGGTIDISNHTFVGYFEFTNPGSIAFSGSNTAQTLTIAGTPGDSSTVYFSPQIGDNGTGQTSVVAADGSFWRFSGANTYTGSTIIQNGGTLVAINATGSATGTGLVTINSGGRLVIGSNSPSGAVSSNINNNGSLEFNRSSNYTYSGVIAGSGYVNQGAAGVITLTGANTYTGSTSIGSGIIADGTSANHQLGFGAVTIASGAALTLTNNTQLENSAVDALGGSKLAGQGSIANGLGAATTVESGATLAPGLTGANAIGSLTFDDLTLQGGSILEWNLKDPSGTVLDAGTKWDLVSISNYSQTLHFDSSVTTGNKFTIKAISVDASGNPGVATGFAHQAYSWVIFAGGPTAIDFANAFDPAMFNIDGSAFATNLGGGTFSLTQDTFNHTLLLNFTPVPEPSTYALLALGLAGSGVAAWRKRRGA